jgi:hypothetical protein
MLVIRHTTFRPHLETLDDRIVPAGNVAASGGEVLQLRGDGVSNQVRISQNAAGSILIEGLDGTTINGRAAVRFNGAGLEKVDIKLFGGHDTLIIRTLRATTDINIEMDQGNDVVRLGNVRAGVNLSVKTDSGYDQVSAAAIRTGSDFYVETGEGPSSVTISQSQIGKTLTVIGGDRADRVAITGTTAQEDLNVEVKEGNDRVDLTNVRSGKNIKVDAQTGNDFVAVTNVRAAADAVFLGGDGFDTFDNNGVSAGEKLEIKEFERRV